MWCKCFLSSSYSIWAKWWRSREFETVMFCVCRRTCPWLTFCLWGTAVCLSRKCGRCVRSVYRLCRASDPPTFFTPCASHPTHWPSTPMGMFASWSSSVVSLHSEYFRTICRVVTVKYVPSEWINEFLIKEQLNSSDPMTMLWALALERVFLSSPSSLRSTPWLDSTCGKVNRLDDLQRHTWGLTDEITYQKINN